MQNEYIKCSCCGEMVPASELELSFFRPDAVAQLSEDERESRCEQNGDFYILDHERYFIRGVIPLPLHDRARDYAIGAWAEVDEDTFQQIWDLWDEENVEKREAFNGRLANQIPLTLDSDGCSIAIRLKSDTRPHFIIADDACTLYQEQLSGISMHRANEYSDIVLIKTGEFAVIEEQMLEADTCSCCGKPVANYCGRIEKVINEQVYADYWLSIPEGHGGFFTLAVSIKEGGQPRVGVALGEATQEGLRYRVQDKADSPWKDFGEYGAILDRQDVLSDRTRKLFFDFIDKIAGSDSRLLAHITPYLDAE